MDFHFTNLLGSPYRGGNLLLRGQELYSAVGNRVAVTDLSKACTQTLPCEASFQIGILAVNPDRSLLLAVDVKGRCLLVNTIRRVLLHRFSLRGTAAAAEFSPDGKYIALAVGKALQIWHAPAAVKAFAPMELLRKHGCGQADVSAIAWSESSAWLVAASKDLTIRIFSVDAPSGYTVPVLSGHKEAVIACFFAGSKVAKDTSLLGGDSHALYSISRDGALFCWGYEHGSDERQARKRRKTRTGKLLSARSEENKAIADLTGSEEQVTVFSGGTWALGEKHFFNRRGAKLTAASYCPESGILVVSFSSGVFELFEMPSFTSIQALSISDEPITSICFDNVGKSLAIGCASLGQLLVWDWQSETYMLKQQGHFQDITCLAYSPDGAFIATGADDAKVKMWMRNSGFCFVTFSEHSGPVTGVVFLPNSAAVVSSSLDGTVRAYDLIRYRNFRTMTAPTPQQFSCVAVDPSGEVVVAGSVDEFQIFVWSIKNARLLDILASHEGPIAALAFSPTQSLLVSASWDKTIRSWDVFSGKGGLEVLQHNHDVLAIAFKPDGKLIASATLDGQIIFWDVPNATIEGTIEGRRDLAGGRGATDRRAAGNSTKGGCFTSLAFSADGSWLLAGGSSKYVCLYDVVEKVMLRRFQLSSNRSLDGVLDQLNSSNITDGGPLDLIADAASDEEDSPGLPKARSDLPGTQMRAAIRARAVALSPTEQQFAVATTEGLLLYSLQDGTVFDPTDLGQETTPQAVHAALAASQPLRALLIALRLRDPALVQQVLLATPASEVGNVASRLPSASLGPVLESLAAALSSTPHLEFVLTWVRETCAAHGTAIMEGSIKPALRALHRAVADFHDQLIPVCDSNLYTLQYLVETSPV